MASGPSLTTEDCERLKGEKVIAINCSIQLAPFADILYACDYAWWAEYRHMWQGFAGLRVTLDKRASEEFGLIHADLPKGEPRGSGGYQAAFLAHLLGANPIYLLGFDCMPKGPSNHWHADHGKKMNNPSDHVYAGWRKSMSRLNGTLQAEGVSLINCTRDTALTIPRQTLEGVLNAEHRYQGIRQQRA